MKKQLVIVTTHFGTNFSGGSAATCEVFGRLQEDFEHVYVIGTALGKHPFQKLTFFKYRSWVSAIRKVREKSKEDVIFYGDFYNSFLFILARVEFHFTYHDNWPELGALGGRSKWQSFAYTRLYQWVFRKAKTVTTVSQFKYRYVKRHAKLARLVPNGYNVSSVGENRGKGPDQGRRRLIMVGNVDRRKYQMALPVLTGLVHLPVDTIDIYGHVIDRRLSAELVQIPKVRLMGFHDVVPYVDYHLLLHTSVAESFGMVFCEALAHKLPVVAFDSGGAKEIIPPSAGALVPPFDIQAMKLAIKTWLEHREPIPEVDLSAFSWKKASHAYRSNLQLC